MRALFFIGFALVVLALTASHAVAALPEPHVLAVGTQFVPAVLVVEVGQTVTWETPVISHTVSTTNSIVNGAQGQANDPMNGDEDPDTFYAALAPSSTVTHAFMQPGTHTYFCAAHKGMLGTVVVQ